MDKIIIENSEIQISLDGESKILNRKQSERSGLLWRWSLNTKGEERKRCRETPFYELAGVNFFRVLNYRKGTCRLEDSVI